MPKQVNAWEKDAEFGSDILGNGSCFGDLTGKVKTRQIGFIRDLHSEVRRKGHVSNKGRGKASTSPNKQGKRG